MRFKFSKMAQILILPAVFLAGVLFHKFDVHLTIKSIIRGDQSIIKEQKPETVIIEGETVTLGATQSRGEAYEETQLDALKQEDFPSDRKAPRADYRNYLDVALGFSTPVIATHSRSGTLKAGAGRSFAQGNLEEVFLEFNTPPLAVRSLYARHRSTSNEIVVILHGLGSTADKVMGIDVPDYHRELGKKLFVGGRDVLAIDTTSKAYVGSTLGLRLEFYGTTTHGLISRATCELVRRLDLRQKYRRVFLYGLSNGGELANHMATLCDGFDLVISDDGTPNWRNAMWNVPGQLVGNAKYPMFTRRLRPLFAETSVADLFYHAASPLVVILAEKEVQAYATELGLYMQASRSPRAGAAVNFLVKQTEHHAPEITSIILPLLEGRYEKLGGFSFDRER